MIDFKQSGFRALRHAAKAIQRGQLDVALRWLFIIDRLTAVATRISDIRGHRHFPRPLPPRPEPVQPPPAKPASARKRSTKAAPTPAAAQPKPSCPHSRLSAACFCKDAPAP